MKFELFPYILEKYTNIRFYENASTGNRVFPRRQTNKYDEAIVAFRNFQNAPKNLFKHFTFHLVKRFSYIKYATN